MLTNFVNKIGDTDIKRTLSYDYIVSVQSKGIKTINVV